MLELSQLDTEALGHKGLALLESGKVEESIICFSKALAINKTHAFSLCHKARAAAFCCRREEALLYFDAALAILPDELFLHYCKVDFLFAQLGQMQAALSCVQAALDSPEL